MERGLRLDGDLERLWWKLFIHVNSDLSEISQVKLWLLDTSASRGRQSVAKMMTSFAFSCLSYHRGGGGGVIGDAETPRFPCCQRSHGTPGPSLPLDDRSNVQSPPDPKPVIWLVSMGFRLYCRLSHAALTLLTVRAPHRAILPWARYRRIDTLRLNQNARWKDPLLATPVTTPG